MKNVYIVYESNYGDLILDGCEATQIIGIFSNKDKAYECKMEQIDTGIENGYLIDEDNKNFQENDTVIMFKDEQENWSCFYEIIIEKINLQ